MTSAAPVSCVGACSCFCHATDTTSSTAQRWHHLSWFVHTHTQTIQRQVVSCSFPPGSAGLYSVLLCFCWDGWIALHKPKHVFVCSSEQWLWSTMKHLIKTCHAKIPVNVFVRAGLGSVCLCAPGTKALHKGLRTTEGKKKERSETTSEGPTLQCQNHTIGIELLDDNTRKPFITR